MVTNLQAGKIDVADELARIAFELTAHSHILDVRSTRTTDRGSCE
jgi:hypothetical protein